MEKEELNDVVNIPMEEIEGYAYCDTKKETCLNDCGPAYFTPAYKSDLL